MKLKNLTALSFVACLGGALPSYSMEQDNNNPPPNTNNLPPKEVPSLRDLTASHVAQNFQEGNYENPSEIEEQLNNVPTNAPGGGTLGDLVESKINRVCPNQEALKQGIANYQEDNFQIQPYMYKGNPFILTSLVKKIKEKGWDPSNIKVTLKTCNEESVIPYGDTIPVTKITATYLISGELNGDPVEIGIYGYKEPSNSN